VGKEHLQASLRYRPQFFRDVLGQPAVVRVLQNSIKFGKVSSSYLFAGQRGTGKTSVARVFAKVLNCDDRKEHEPCGVCDSCLNITSSCDPNVIELDAASHGLKEDIAELQKMAVQVPYPGKKKVVILDEVHMVTPQGQNAFLKLLEEPPKEVIFILVTTEPTKLLNTILSRCFRLDFRAISVPEVEKSLRRIFADAQVQVEDSVIRMLLNNSEGSLRDMQQVADQLILMADGRLTEQLVSDLLGYMSVDQYKELAFLLCCKDFGQWVDGIAEMFESGADLSYVLTKCLPNLIRDFRCSTCVDDDWDYLSGIAHSSFKKNVALTLEEMDLLQQAMEDVWEMNRMGSPPRLCMEVFYAKFLDEARYQAKCGS